MFDGIHSRRDGDDGELVAVGCRATRDNVKNQKRLFLSCIRKNNRRGKKEKESKEKKKEKKKKRKEIRTEGAKYKTAVPPFE